MRRLNSDRRICIPRCFSCILEKTQQDGRQQFLSGKRRERICIWIGKRYFLI